MSWLSRLFGGEDTADAATGGDTETVRKIVSELKSLPQDRARYIGAFAYILSRIAYADGKITDDEVTAMEQMVTRYGGMPEAQAVLAVEIARNQTLLFGGTENYLVTREFKQLSTREQREQLLHCLFAVSAADDSIDSAEEAQINQIAQELGITHRELVAVRASYSDKREVVRMGRALS